MRIDEILNRKAEIRSLLDSGAENLDIDGLTEEVRKLNNEEAEIRKKAEKEAALRSAVSPADAAEIRRSKEKEVPAMHNEVRNSPAYINAYANYLKTGKDAECRAMLTGNATGGTVPVPAMVEDRIRHAWDNEPIMSLVPKTYVPGNLKIGFEKSASDAAAHAEGAAAPAEGENKLGVVTMVPETIMKWITVSDEALALTGEAFLNYVLDELAQKIAKKAANDLVAKIVASPEASTDTAPAVAKLTVTKLATTTVAEAIGKLSDEVANPVIIMNKASYAPFKAVQYANGYAVDVFEGCTPLFNNSLPTFADAKGGKCFAIVGGLAEGTQANFPAGDSVNILIDEVTLAEQGLVKIVGKELLASAVVAPFAFVQLCNGTAG